ncbi:MAG TPA: GDP-mannose 4,6-dehydratase [Flavobacteriales bacterium]|nr:GDP-mannose 4,6-dehydratase [Flavobacteriales bacterium]
MSNKVALICGIRGQDGSYLAEFLLNKGYEVWGTSRDIGSGNFNNLSFLGIQGKVHLISMNTTDFISVFRVINEISPDEVYNLSGQSSVGLSFDQPKETIESIVLGMLNILEAVRESKKIVRIYHAGSSECFGNTKNKPANENTPFDPLSPYAIAKTTASMLVKNYRSAYGMHVSNGILFNHESVLRPERFVTQKILHTAKKIYEGSSEKLSLGRIDIARDWGWAPEYVEAMWIMLQQDKSDDYVIATGVTTTLEDFVSQVFGFYNLDWKDHVSHSKALVRPLDIRNSYADPSKAEKLLGWSASVKMPDLIGKLIQ